MERAFLVAVESRMSNHRWTSNDSLQELSSLARAAGADVVGMFVQKLDAPSSTHYIGRGKIAELVNRKQEAQYNTVIFDDELSPRQQRNLEELLQVKIIDRTALILDTFARQARTHEGRLQVELAQHQYLLPRLVGQWKHLERLGAGIGTRGPGESQLETDRRLIRNRINRLKDELENVRRHRALYRKRRKERAVPIVALVGYTNAGKSALFNALSKAQVIVEDKLFSTLDPVTRCLTLPNGRQFLITDTVGFIHKLPLSIVVSFRATLEELSEADLLLHVVDISHETAANQCRTVMEIIAELHLEHTPRITVFNKLDLTLNSEVELEALTTIPYLGEQIVVPDGKIALISATKGWGMDQLRDRITSHLDNTLMQGEH
ncbi:MAG: GTPase HflX [Dehalococcoidia bacterium]|nr:GTPase HflX [Dehalococcoidia bacterium]